MIAIPKFTTIKRSHGATSWSAWSTQQEMDFIDRLGSFSARGLELGSRVLLHRYEVALDRLDAAIDAALAGKEGKP